MKVCNIAILFGRKLMKNLIKILIILINCLAAAESGVPGARPGGNLKFWIDSSLIITVWWFCPKLKSNYKTIYLHKIVISNRNLFGRDLQNQSLTELWSSSNCSFYQTSLIFSSSFRYVQLKREDLRLCRRTFVNTFAGVNWI